MVIDIALLDSKPIEVLFPLYKKRFHHLLGSLSEFMFNGELTDKQNLVINHSIVEDKL